MENQQKLMELLRQGFLAAPKEQKPKNVSDFMVATGSLFRIREAFRCRANG